MPGRHLFARTALVMAVATGAACSTDSSSSVTDPTSTIPVSNVGGVPNGQAVAALDAVRSGNAQSIVAAPALVPPGVPLPPFIEARLYAISNIAMHDALNAIVPRFERYADTGPIERD